MSLDPVYQILDGYSKEDQAARDGCSVLTQLKYGLEGVVGIAGTGAIATGGAGALGGLFGAADESGAASTYIDLTRAGSIRNIGTDTTNTEFADTLTSNGWTSSVSKDGAVQIFEKNGAKYVLRQKADSYSGWTADFTPAGSARITLKIRLGYAP
jgi:hypothetical protein